MRRGLCSLCVLFLVQCLGGMSLAGEAKQDTQEYYKLDQMVVTATRRPVEAEKAPAVVQVITREDIERMPATNVADLLVNQVGITVNQPQGQATVTPQRFQMRGFTDTKKVLLLMDGQPMNSGWTDYFYFSQLPLEAVERIEIVRGPFSSLYGTNAMGGVINIITRNGWDKKFKASGLYEDGEFGETEAIATVEGTPAEGKVSAFLSYSDYTIDNYYKFENKEKLLEADSDLNTLADVDEDLANRDYEHQRFHGSVRIKASDDLAFDISGGRMDSESGYGMGTNLGNRNQRDIDRYYLNGRGSLKLTPELDLFFGVQYLDEDITYSGETLTTINYITVGPPANPTYIPTSFDVEQTESKSGFDTTRAFLGGNWQISNTNVLTLGGEFVWNKGYSRVVRAGTDDVVDVLGRSGERVDVSEELGSLYGQDEWRFFDDQLALVFGLRYDDYDFLDGEWSPRGAATWHYNESGRVKASVGKAFHAPSMNDRKTNPWTLSVPKSPWQPAVTRIPNPDLQPETAITYELSFENEFVDKKLKTRITPFMTDAEDFIQSESEDDPLDPRSATLSKPVNVQDVKIEGVETEITYSPMPELTLFANHAYVETRDDATDDILDGHPRNVAQFGWQWYSRHFNDLFGFQWGFVGRYKDEQTDRPPGRKADEDPDHIGGYTIFNTRIGVDFWHRRIKLYTDVNNIFDIEVNKTGSDDFEEERNFVVGMQAQYEF